MKKNFTGDSKKEGSGWASVKTVLIVIVSTIIKKIDNTLFKRTKNTIRRLARVTRVLFMRLNYLTPVNFVVSRIRWFFSSIIKPLKK